MHHSIPSIFSTLSGIAQSKNNVLSSKIAAMDKTSQKKLERFLKSFQNEGNG